MPPEPPQFVEILGVAQDQTLRELRDEIALLRAALSVLLERERVDPVLPDLMKVDVVRAVATQLTDDTLGRIQEALSQPVELAERTLEQLRAILPEGGTGGPAANQMILGGGTSRDITDRPNRQLGIVTAQAPEKTLTERMMAKQPVVGARLWLDLADPAYNYIGEADVGATETSAVFNIIRIPIDAAGNYVGAVQEVTGVAWANRTSNTLGWS